MEPKEKIQEKKDTSKKHGQNPKPQQPKQTTGNQQNDKSCGCQ